LVAKFPGANFQTLDIFDPQVMTEPSISIARRIKSFPVHAAAAHYDALPCASGSFEAAFLFFAAHELRRHDQRVLLFKEVARIVMPGGSIILVEHARDLWNFLAFGPGAFHFFSQRVWRSATFEAGLIVHSHRSITPFVHVYSLRKIA
jgi:SAM-dependent methyltransferase